MSIQQRSSHQISAACPGWQSSSWQRREKATVRTSVMISEADREGGEPPGLRRVGLHQRTEPALLVEHTTVAALHLLPTCSGSSSIIFHVRLSCRC